MAVALSNLIVGESEVGGSSVNTTSISPVANRLYLLTVVSRTNIGVDTNVPTVTGAGMTWVQVNTVLFDTTSTSRKRVTVFRALSASPGSGALTIDYGGQAQTSFTWSVEEVTGMDTSGTNGSGAIVQSVTNSSAPSTATGVSITLASFGDANNVAFGGFGTGGTSSLTVGSGYTALANHINTGSATCALLSEYDLANNTTVNMTNASSEVGGVGIEIKAAGAASAPTVTDSAATSIADTSATGNGNVTSDGGATVTERGFVLSTSANPTTSDTKFVGSGTTGAYTGSMTGLTHATTYHYRAYAINSVGTSYGADQSFTTLADAPTVTDSAATSVTDVSATGNGNVTSDGGSAITERGVVWGTSANPTTASNLGKQTAAGTTGAFTASMTGLTRATAYHYRAYAINAIGTSYGADQTFTTLQDAPTVTDSGATGVGATSATANGNVTDDGGASITERGFVYSTSANPTTADTKVIVAGTTGAYTGSISGLTTGTTYHYRAYAINSIGTSYGADQSFTPIATGGIGADANDSRDYEERLALRVKESLTNSNFSLHDLRQQFYAGGNLMLSQNDAIRAYLQSQTGLTTIQSLTDLWRQFFIGKGVANQVSLSDMARSFFSNTGF